MSPQPSATPDRVKIESLSDAIESLEGAIDSGDEMSILKRLGDALEALYSAWQLLDVNGKRQVEWAGTDPRKRTLVALVYARGESTHQRRHVSMLAGYGEAPYGLGPYGDGWLWQPCPARRADYKESQRLYDEHVVWQPLIGPLRDAPQLIEELYRVRSSAS